LTTRASQIHHGYLRIGRIDHSEVSRRQFGPLAHDVVGALAGEHKVLDVVALELDAAAQRENPVLAGRQDIGEALLPNEQNTLVVSYQNTS